MKLLKIVGVLLLVLLVVLLVAALFLGPIVRTAVETAGPRFAQVPIELQKSHISIFTGRARLEGLSIGNPEGFKSPHAINIGGFSMHMSVPSILSDKVVIREIVIDAPEIMYEISRSGSNLARIQKNLAGEDAGEEVVAADDFEEAAAAVQKEGKKLQIDSLVIKNGRVRISSGLTGDRGATLDLPTVRLEGIGRDKEGASAVEVASGVMAAIREAVREALGNAGGVLGDAAGKLGPGADAVGDAAGAAREAAADGARSAREAAGRGVSRLMDGLRRGEESEGNDREGDDR